MTLTDEELEIIGRLSAKYDVLVIEDLAYMTMDFRCDMSRPFEPPFQPSVRVNIWSYFLSLYTNTQSA